jgi:hypothetical protein
MEHTHGLDVVDVLGSTAQNAWIFDAADTGSHQGHR